MSEPTYPLLNHKLAVRIARHANTYGWADVLGHKVTADDVQAAWRGESEQSSFESFVLQEAGVAS